MPFDVRLLPALALAACVYDNGLNTLGDPPDTPIDTGTDADPATEPATDTDPATEPDTDTATSPPGTTCGVVTANAGPDRVVEPLDTPTLSGAGSSDSGGCALSYRWRALSKPTDSSLFLLMPNQRDLHPFIDVVGTYEFELKVTNTSGTSDTDTVLVTAENSKDFYVQLTWDAAVDLDLHVMDAGHGLFECPYDACYANKTAEWGSPTNADDNGSLDWDMINGYGPETVTTLAPANGTYDIKVHYYGIDGSPDCGDSFTCPSTSATVKIYNLGNLLYSQTHSLGDQGDVWNVGTIAWPSLAFTPTGSLTSTSLTSCQ